MPSVSAEGTEGSASVEDAIGPVMNALSTFRDQIKKKATDGPQEMFKQCDEIRDDVLPFLGIKLEDRKQDQPAIWKFADREALVAERQAKIDKARQVEEAKRAKKEAELKKKSTPGSEWFKVFPEHKDGVYTQWDSEGLPSHTRNKAGEEKKISDQAKNGLKKLMKKQDGVYQKWLAANPEGVAAAASQEQEPVKALAKGKSQSQSAPAKPKVAVQNTQVMDELELKLEHTQWLGGQQPSSQDAEMWANLAQNQPNADSHPNTFSWWVLVSHFNDTIRSSWK